MIKYVAYVLRYNMKQGVAIDITPYSGDCSQPPQKMFPNRYKYQELFFFY